MHRVLRTRRKCPHDDQHDDQHDPNLSRAQGLVEDVENARVWGGLHYRTTMTETAKLLPRIARDVGQGVLPRRSEAPQGRQGLTRAPFPLPRRTRARRRVGGSSTLLHGRPPCPCISSRRIYRGRAPARRAPSDAEPGRRPRRCRSGVSRFATSERRFCPTTRRASTSSRRLRRTSSRRHAEEHGLAPQGSCRRSTRPAPATIISAPASTLQRMARAGLEPATPRFSAVCSTN